MTETVTLFSEAVYLSLMVTEPDEREPGKPVVQTFAGNHRIARRPIDLAEVDGFQEICQQPRHLMYVAWESDPGIQAQLFALMPDESEAWKGAQNMEAYYLGTVIRVKECRVAPTDLLKEAADHFAAILGGGTVEPIEQLLKRLG